MFATGAVSLERANGSPLSTVAGVALATVTEPPEGRTTVPADGWLFWRFRWGDGQFRPLDVLRQKYRERMIGAHR